MIRNITLSSLFLFLSFFNSHAQVLWQSVHPAQVFHTLASTANGNLYAYNPAELRMSNGAGGSGTWGFIPGAPAFINSGSLFSNGNTLFITVRSGAGFSGLLRSADFGTTWQSANAGLSGNDSAWVSGVFPLTSNHLLLVCKEYLNSKIYSSADNGLTWSGPFQVNQPVVNILRKGNDTYLLTTGSIFKSPNNGGSWSQLGGISFSSDIGKAVVLGSGSFLMHSGNYFYRSDDDGASWNGISPVGLPTGIRSMMMVKSPSSDTLFLNTLEQGGAVYNLYMSPDAGATWSHYTSGLPIVFALSMNNFENGLLFDGNGYLYASIGGHGIYRTSAPVASLSISNQHNSFVPEMKLFPNPAGDWLEVQCQLEQNETCSISLMDATGKIITREMQGGKNKQFQLRFELKSLAPGTYFVQIQTNGGAATRSFVKQ